MVATLVKQTKKHIYVGDRYDWTTGGPYNGNAWMKYRVAPRAHPLWPCVFACCRSSGSKGAFRLPGATWDHFRCMVEPAPGHIRCRALQVRKLSCSQESSNCKPSRKGSVGIRLYQKLCVLEKFELSRIPKHANAQHYSGEKTTNKHKQFSLIVGESVGGRCGWSCVSCRPSLGGTSSSLSTQKHYTY